MKPKPTKIMSLTIIGLLVLVMSIAVATAAPSLTINTVTWQENTVVNISTKDANDDSLVNMTHITVRFSASDTANSSTSIVRNITNTTATNFDLGYANFTFGNDIVLEDTAVGSATAISTGVGDSDAVTSSATTVTVDRTDPTTPTSVSPTGTQTDGDQTFSATVTGTDTTACELRFDSTNPGQSIYQMTHSGNSCTLSLSGMPDTNYEYLIRASDGTNTSDTALQELTITGTSNSGRKAKILTTVGGESTQEGVQRGLSILEGDGQPGQIRDFVSQEIQGRELAKTGVGFVGGAVVGTFVIPGLGTAIGGVIGAIIGLAL